MKLLLLFTVVTLSLSLKAAAAPVRTLSLLLGPEVLHRADMVALVPGLRYDIKVTEKFAVGFLMAYRRFSASYSQLGYGTLLTHRVPTSESQGWIMEYGLLASMSTSRGRPRTALAHDTRLAAGYFCDDVSLTLAYHISTLSYYEVESQNQNRLALTVEYKFWESK